MYRPLVKVHLWSGLRALAGGQAAVELRAGTIGQMLDALVKEYPGLEAAVEAGRASDVAMQGLRAELDGCLQLTNGTWKIARLVQRKRKLVTVLRFL